MSTFEVLLWVISGCSCPAIAWPVQATSKAQAETVAVQELCAQGIDATPYKVIWRS